MSDIKWHNEHNFKLFSEYLTTVKPYLNKYEMF